MFTALAEPSYWARALPSTPSSENDCANPLATEDADTGGWCSSLFPSSYTVMHAPVEILRSAAPVVIASRSLTRDAYGPSPLLQFQQQQHQQLPSQPHSQYDAYAVSPVVRHSPPPRTVYGPAVMSSQPLNTSSRSSLSLSQPQLQLQLSRSSPAQCNTSGSGSRLQSPGCARSLSAQSFGPPQPQSAAAAAVHSSAQRSTRELQDTRELRDTQLRGTREQRKTRAPLAAASYAQRASSLSATAESSNLAGTPIDAIMNPKATASVPAATAAQSAHTNVSASAFTVAVDSVAAQAVSSAFDCRDSNDTIEIADGSVSDTASAGAGARPRDRSDRDGTYTPTHSDRDRDRDRERDRSERSRGERDRSDRDRGRDSVRATDRDSVRNVLPSSTDSMSVSSASLSRKIVSSALVTAAGNSGDDLLALFTSHSKSTSSQRISASSNASGHASNSYSSRFSQTSSSYAHAYSASHRDTAHTADNAMQNPFEAAAAAAAATAAAVRRASKGLGSNSTNTSRAVNPQTSSVSSSSNVRVGSLSHSHVSTATNHTAAQTTGPTKSMHFAARASENPQVVNRRSAASIPAASAVSGVSVSSSSSSHAAVLAAAEDKKRAQEAELAAFFN